MKDKIFKSAQIALAGAVLASLIMLQPEISDYIVDGSPIDWRPALNAGFTAIMTWVVNTLRVVSKGGENE